MEPNLENRLRAWTPRHPSAELRERLFSTEISPGSQELVLTESTSPRGISWNWLAPVAMGAFSLLMIFGGHSQSAQSLADAETNLFFASVTVTSVPPRGTESRVLALSKEDLNLKQNVWRDAVLASTNFQQSSKRTAASEKTNRLTL